MAARSIDLSPLFDMEDDLRNLRRLANVLKTLGTHDDIVDHDCVYVVGCYLSEMSRRLEGRFDSMTGGGSA